MMETTIVEYNPHRYQFREWARAGLGKARLDEALHSSAIRKMNRSPTCNQLTQSFKEIEQLYAAFVSDVLREVVGEIAAYQSPPSFRFHYCGLGSSVFHRDKDFGVEDGRVNVWVPLTEVWGDNSLWIENAVGTKNYRPVQMSPGQALIFDGVNLSHGSKINTTHSTRISFDFRVLPGAGPAIPTPY